MLLHFKLINVIITKRKSTKGGFHMSKVCAISGKGPLSGNKRSHSMRATKRKWDVNLQSVKVMVDGKPTKMKISTRALRTLKKQETGK